MANPNLPSEGRGPQSGQGGAGGEPKGARIEAEANDRRPPQAPEAGQPRRREHSSDKAQPGYRARPAGQSGLGAQDDQTSALGEPHGDGHYLATDRGDKPLRDG